MGDLTDEFGLVGRQVCQSLGSFCMLGLNMLAQGLEAGTKYLQACSLDLRTFSRT